MDQVPDDLPSHRHPAGAPGVGPHGATAPNPAAATHGVLHAAPPERSAPSGLQPTCAVRSRVESSCSRLQPERSRLGLPMQPTGGPVQPSAFRGEPVGPRAQPSDCRLHANPRWPRRVRLSVEPPARGSRRPQWRLRQQRLRLCRVEQPPCQRRNRLARAATSHDVPQKVPCFAYAPDRVM